MNKQQTNHSGNNKYVWMLIGFWGYIVINFLITYTLVLKEENYLPISFIAVGLMIMTFIMSIINIAQSNGKKWVNITILSMSSIGVLIFLLETIIEIFKVV